MLKNTSSKITHSSFNLEKPQKLHLNVLSQLETPLAENMLFLSSGATLTVHPEMLLLWDINGSAESSTKNSYA